MSFINDYHLNLLIFILTIVVNNCFLILPVSRSISRKISAQYTIDDEIDFDDLNVDDEGDGNSSSLDTVDIMQRNVSSTTTTNGGSRRESRGVSQVGITIMNHSSDIWVGYDRGSHMV